MHSMPLDFQGDFARHATFEDGFSLSTLNSFALSVARGFKLFLKTLQFCCLPTEEIHGTHMLMRI